jgi:hypothetical protein
MATTRNLEAMFYKFGRLTKQAYETSSCECSSGCVSELCFCRRGPQTCRVDKCDPQAEQQVPTFDPLSWPSSCSGTIPLAYPLSVRPPVFVTCSASFRKQTCVFCFRIATSIAARLCGSEHCRVNPEICFLYGNKETLYHHCSLTLLWNMPLLVSKRTRKD